MRISMIIKYIYHYLVHTSYLKNGKPNQRSHSLHLDYLTHIGKVEGYDNHILRLFKL